MARLLFLAEEVRRREAARAQERQDAEQGWLQERRGVMWQCVALSFAGVPLFGLSLYLDDARRAQVALAAAFVVSYAFPLARWLVYHLRCVDRDDY